MDVVPELTFQQLDVFTSDPLAGNPVAVVHDAEGLTDEQMHSFARWSNLSECAFLLPPTSPDADYRVRIFGPSGELPFAGHPTLGSARSWLDRGGAPTGADEIVQEGVVGLIRIRADGDEMAFAAPPLVRNEPLDRVTLVRCLAALGVAVADVHHARLLDNGARWIAIMLGSAASVLAVRPDFVAMEELVIGLIGAYPRDGPADYEVRAFAPKWAVMEDPVSGSLNAGLAQWLIPEGLVPERYTVQQGTTLQRRGRVRVVGEPDGAVWVQGTTRAVVSGTITL